jgi:putative heme-binding domain-containing protein
MRRHGDEELARLLGKHFGEETAGARPALAEVARVREVLETAPGNPYRGRPLFQQRCATCHVLFYEGGRIGPDLTHYQRDDLETLLTSVLAPNAEVREGYEGISLTTRDGRLLSGFVTDQGTQAVTLRGFDGRDVTLPRDGIAEMTPLGRSLMPEGLLDNLSDQELRDFFAYVRSAQPFLKD